MGGRRGRERGLPRAPRAKALSPARAFFSSRRRSSAARIEGRPRAPSVSLRLRAAAAPPPAARLCSGGTVPSHFFAPARACSRVRRAPALHARRPPTSSVGRRFFSSIAEKGAAFLNWIGLESARRRESRAGVPVPTAEPRDGVAVHVHALRAHRLTAPASQRSQRANCTRTPRQGAESVLTLATLPPPSRCRCRRLGGERARQRHTAQR